MTTTPVTTKLRDLATSLEDDLHVFNDSLSAVTQMSDAERADMAEDVRRALRRLKFDVELAASRLDSALAPDRDSYASAADEQLRALHAALDMLRVRQSLATATGRQEADRLLAAAENAWLAARSRLEQAQADAGLTLSELRGQVEKVLADAIAAVRDAAAAFRRTATSGA